MKNKPKQFDKQIGLNLKQARINRSMQQNQLADKLDLNPQTISNYENGKRGLTVGTLKEFADALSIKVTDLLKGVPENAVPESSSNTTMVPVLGSIKAGPDGIIQDQNEDEYLPLYDPERRNKDSFWLIVDGDSMTGDGIQNNDIVLIKPCEFDESYGNTIYVVSYGYENAAIKRLSFVNGHVTLISSNPSYQPITVNNDEHFHIFGRVIMSQHKF
ncbi:XRE family transcriptional regulator [Oenococcus oeni]